MRRVAELLQPLMMTFLAGIIVTLHPGRASEMSCSGQDTVAVEILHPASGQILAAPWQDLVIASVRCFSPPSDGSIAVYIDDVLSSRLNSWPMTLFLPPLSNGLHTIALSLQTDDEVLAQHEVTVTYASRPSVPPLLDSLLATEEVLARNVELADRGVLTVVWTCPDWEIDWIRELLSGAGLDHRIVRDESLSTLVDNALIAVSQNDERNRPSDRLAAYFLRFRASGFRVGVLHMSDEDYTAHTYFYPWVHYVLRNHWSAAVADLPHVLAFPLGYKKGFNTEIGKNAAVGSGRNRSRQQEDTQSDSQTDPRQERDYTWSFAGQIHDKLTRVKLIESARKVPGGFTKLTGYWNDPSGLTTEQYRSLLHRTKFVLCPRGFVHPESFRLSEALEADAVPIIEDDAYFDHLLGSDHPIPRLLPPVNCSRPGIHP